MEKIKKLLTLGEPDNVFLRAFSALCLSSVIFCVRARFDFTDMSAYAGISLTTFVIVFAVFFGLLSLAAYLSAKKGKHSDRRALLINFGFVALSSVVIAQNYYYTLGMIICAAILIWYYTTKGYFTYRQPSKKKTIIGVAVAGGLFTLIFGTFAVVKYLSNNTPTYDFGIFCQMFSYMRSTLQPLTTVERNGLLSHFSVHMSLIYYLVLPFYAVFPSPVTVQLMQVFALGSAAVPLYFLCRRAGFSNLTIVTLSVAVMFHPALFGGGSYDFHENCFLVPLLLWMFYFFEKEKYIPMAVFAALVCTVKEDAPVYIIFFALWMFFARKKYGHAMLFAGGALIYFVVVLSWMAKYGDGIMSGRYSNFFTSADEGLFSAVKNVLANPAYVFTQLFINKEGEYQDKLLFILQMLLPFAFMPLCIKKISNIILLCPMILINLMSVYVYQYSNGYQYVCGPLVFVIYLCIVNLQENAPPAGEGEENTDTAAEKKSVQPMLLRIGAVASVLLLSTAYLPKTAQIVLHAAETAGDTKIINEYLESLPEDASLCVSTYLMPKVSRHKIVYEDYYHRPQEGEVIDYVIMDGRYNKQKFIDEYVEFGYEITEEIVNEEGKVLLTVLRWLGN